MTRPLKVALLDLWSLTPYYERYLLEALCAENIDARLFATSYPTAPGYFRQCGVQLAAPINLVGRLKLRSPWLRRIAKSAEYLLNQGLLAAKWLISPPDVVHIQWLPMFAKSGLDRILLIYLKFRKIPLVYTVHNLLPHDAPANAKQTYKELYAQMDRLICHTEASVTELHRDFGIPLDRISLIPHGPIFHDLPRPSREGARKSLQLSPDDVAVLWQGIVSPYKGIQALLEAWPEVRRRCPTAKLIIAGTGKPEFVRGVEQRIKDTQAGDSILSHLRFIEPEEMPGFFVAADVLVYPYSEVTTSGALMTGLTYQKAIVASDLAGFRQVLPDDAARYVPTGDISALTNALSEVVASSDLRSELSARVAELQTENAWGDIARRTLHCYEQALAMYRPSPARYKKLQAGAQPACSNSQQDSTSL